MNDEQALDLEGKGIVAFGHFPFSDLPSLSAYLLHNHYLPAKVYVDEMNPYFSPLCSSVWS